MSDPIKSFLVQPPGCLYRQIESGAWGRVCRGDVLDEWIPLLPPSAMVWNDETGAWEPYKAVDPDKPVTLSEAGKKGGAKVKEKYGSEYYKRIGAIGGSKSYKVHGPEHFSQIGIKGGKTMAKKHESDDYYAEIGRKSARRPRAEKLAAAAEGAGEPEEGGA